MPAAVQRTAGAVGRMRCRSIASRATTARTPGRASHVRGHGGPRSTRRGAICERSDARDEGVGRDEVARIARAERGSPDPRRCSAPPAPSGACDAGPIASRATHGSHAHETAPMNRRSVPRRWFGSLLALKGRRSKAQGNAAGGALGTCRRKSSRPVGARACDASPLQGDGHRAFVVPWAPPAALPQAFDCRPFRARRSGTSTTAAVIATAPCTTRDALTRPARGRSVRVA